MQNTKDVSNIIVSNVIKIDKGHPNKKKIKIFI